jgi:hypothetical protein
MQRVKEVRQIGVQGIGCLVAPCQPTCLYFAAVLQVNSLELKTNLLAAYVSAGLSAQLPELMRQLGIKPRDSFEIAFNRCGQQVLPQACIPDNYTLLLLNCWSTRVVRSLCSLSAAMHAQLPTSHMLLLCFCCSCCLFRCHLGGDVV